MRQKRIYAVLIFAFVTVAVNLKSQYLIQLVNEADYGPTDSAGVANILRNSNNNFVFAGNERINALQCNFKTICNDTNGILSWSQSFNANVKEAYTTASTNDAGGNIFIAGCTYIDSINNQDLTVIKYNAGGVQQWVKNIDGGGIAGGNIDVASDIYVHNATGNIYVTGTSMNNSFPPSLDFVTYKLNSSGNIVWSKRYDFAASMDVPIGISFDASKNRVTVSGTSGNSSNDWEIATVKYDANNGNVVYSNRTTNTVVSQDKETAFITDNNHNVYFIGNVSNGNNEDIKVGKLDSTPTLVWEQSFDGHNLNDGAYDIQLDNLGNVYVAGYSHTSNNSKELVLLKYSPSGVLRWAKPKKTEANAFAEGFKIKIRTNNQIYLGGNERIGNNQDAIILKYDSLGANRIFKRYDKSNWDWLFDLEVDNDDIYASVRSKVSGNYHSMYLHYQERDITPQLSANQDYTKDELIISFNPAILKKSTINNKEFLFGKLGDFIEDTTCVKINARLNTEDYVYNSFNLPARKIFTELTEADSLSVTRLGDVIKVPPFYATIAVKMPSNSGVNFLVIPDSLNKVKPDIFYSGLDRTYKLATPTPTPNDWQYYLQSSLHPTTQYPNAHINADSAWTVVSGMPYVTVGFLDSGIEYFSSSDFDSNNYDGWDYYDNQQVYGTDDCDHGTDVAGIVAPTKNNTIDVAGIAGGDSIAGVTIRDFRIVSNWLPTPTSRILQAINRATRATSDSLGFAINVMNNSFSSNFSSSNSIKDLPFQEQLVFAARHAVAISCAKGQQGAGSGQQFKIANYPGDWNPEIVSCVGGSGTDGQFCKPAGTTTNCPLGNTDYGFNLDFVAPASGTNVITIGTSFSLNHFGYTSASAAHVSGAYALMMSHYNFPSSNWRNLTHEDCENILKRTATDLTITPTYSQTVGWDEVTGYGRINLYQAIKAIDISHYRFRHLNYNHSSNFSSVQTTVFSNQPVKWPAYQSIAAGIYNTDLYKMTNVITFTLAPNEQIIDYWPMYKECFGWSDDTASLSIDKPYFTRIVGVSANTATLETFVYKNLSNNAFFPNTILNARSAITLYTYDPDGTGMNVGITKAANSVTKNYKLKPNPNSGNFSVEFGSEGPARIRYSIHDVMGRQVQAGFYNSEFGVNNIPINISEFTNGIYIISLYEGDKFIYRHKVIKN